ncbi:hypothetical protein M9H77_09453 [Catharanthus roseus]|uniref:Uncharacterized protein n=1 Tax=Catharanthus roseus TaxID=4058 RepID=A0ACC0C0L0_CATRO|nr:hypothetical protein M9H77_09453 [Catharanthus roseus]
MEEQLIQTEQFRKSHVLPRNILQIFREQHVGCAVSTKKIYNVVAKMKKNRMQGRNTTLEIGRDHLCSQEKGMDSEMRDLAFLLDKISTGPISKVRKMCCCGKGVLSPVLPKDLGMTLISIPKVTATKGQRKTNSTKKDKSYWEHMSITYRKIQKLSSSSSGSGFGSESGLCSVGEADCHGLLGVVVKGIEVDE